MQVSFNVRLEMGSMMRTFRSFLRTVIISSGLVDGNLADRLLVRAKRREAGVGTKQLLKVVQRDGASAARMPQAIGLTYPF